MNKKLIVSISILLAVVLLLCTLVFLLLPADVAVIEYNGTKLCPGTDLYVFKEDFDGYNGYNVNTAIAIVRCTENLSFVSDDMHIRTKTMEKVEYVYDPMQEISNSSGIPISFGTMYIPFKVEKIVEADEGSPLSVGDTILAEDVLDTYITYLRTDYFYYDLDESKWNFSLSLMLSDKTFLPRKGYTYLAMIGYSEETEKYYVDADVCYEISGDREYIEQYAVYYPESLPEERMSHKKLIDYLMEKESDYLETRREWFKRYGLLPDGSPIAKEDESS